MDMAIAGDQSRASKINSSTGCSRMIRTACVFITATAFLSDAALAAAPSPPAKKPMQKKASSTSLDPIKIHAWLMYASMGFFLPFGVLGARLMRSARSKEDTSKTLQIIYYLHLVLQTMGVALMTAGAIYSFKNFGFDFPHTHERLGLSLWILVWAQPIIGFLRPNVGMTRARPIWYAIHWLFGTGVVILGFLNIYIGIKIWEIITKERIRTLNIAFSVQVALMAFIYLAQDRWDYFLEQGRGLTKPIAPPSTSFIHPSHVRSSPILYTQVPNSIEYQMRHYLPS